MVPTIDSVLPSLNLGPAVLTQQELLWVDEAIKTHKVDKTTVKEVHRVLRRDDEVGFDRDKQGRFVRRLQVCGTTYEIDIFGNQNGHESEITWNEDSNDDDDF